MSDDYRKRAFLALAARQQSAYEMADAALADESVSFEEKRTSVREFMAAGGAMIRFGLGKRGVDAN